MHHLHPRCAVLLLALPLFALTAAPVLACAACGCGCGSDAAGWEGQGLTADTGWQIDLRYDYLDQDALRSGSHTIAPSTASQVVTPNGPAEVEKYTITDYFTLGLDYAPSPDWGFNAQVPYIIRDHSTLGENSNGSDPADGAYTSNTSNLGDIKLVARYQGFFAGDHFGVMGGLKLPTGSHTEIGISTDPNSPGTVAPIDRGLQPGTGTLDLITGVYYHDSFADDWGYFGQITWQTALASCAGYRPGDSFNANVGLRYTAFADDYHFVPQVQINTRYLIHDTGINADNINTGGTLVYFSPGVVVPVDDHLSLYASVQLPIYQHVNGIQLAPSYTATVGLRLAF